MRSDYRKPPIEIFETNQKYARSVCSDGAVPRKMLISPVFKDLSKSNPKKLVISPKFALKKFLTLDEIQEIVCYNFVKRAVFSMDESLYNEKLLLFEKLIYYIFDTINSVYSRDKNEKEYEVNPLFDWRNSIPLTTPKSICDLIEEMASKDIYKINCCKVALVYEFLNYFKIDRFTKMCKNYRQHILFNLYDDVYNEVMDYIGLSALTTNTIKHVKTRSHLDNYEINEIDPDIQFMGVSRHKRRFKRPNWQDLLRSRLLTARLYRFRKKYYFRVNRFAGNKELLLRGHLKAKYSCSDGWIRENSTRMETYYCKADGGKVSIKVRCKIPAEYLRIFCILREFDFAPEWIPFLKHVEILSNPSKGTFVIYHKYNYPIIGLHDMLLYFIGVNALEETNSIFFTSTSPPETEAEVNNFKEMLKKHKIPDASYVVEYHEEGTKFLEADFAKINLENKRSKAADISFTLYPVYDGKYTVLEIHANAVGPTPYTPIKLVSYVTLQVAKGIVKGMLKASKDFETNKFGKRMNENPERYIWTGDMFRDSVGFFPPGLTEEDPENSQVDTVEKRYTLTRADPSAFIDIDDVSIITYTDN